MKQGRKPFRHVNPKQDWFNHSYQPLKLFHALDAEINENNHEYS